MTNGLYGRCIHDLNPIECKWCKQNQKLRELLEKEDPDAYVLVKSVLKECKK